MPMNYTTLVASKATAGSIKWYINYNYVDPDEILEQAQNWIAQEMRVREMRAEATLSLLINTNTVALPTGFLDPIGPIYNNSRMEKITFLEEGDLMSARSYSSGVLSTAYPSFYSIFNELVQFDSKATAASSLTMLYYKVPTLLASGGASTNFLTTRYSHILRAATNAFAAAFMKNQPLYQSELARAAAMIEKANAMDELSRRGQGGYDNYEYA